MANQPKPKYFNLILALLVIITILDSVTFDFYLVALTSSHVPNILRVIYALALVAFHLILIIGLASRKKWAWYTSMTFFTNSAFALILVLLQNTFNKSTLIGHNLIVNFIAFIYYGFAVVLLLLLLKAFTHQDTLNYFNIKIQKPVTFWGLIILTGFGIFALIQLFLLISK